MRLADAVSLRSRRRKLRLFLDELHPGPATTVLDAGVDELGFGEPVRSSEVVWSLMNEPGVADVNDAQLLRHPPTFESVDFEVDQLDPQVQELGCGDNVELQVNQIARFVDDPGRLWIV